MVIRQLRLQVDSLGSSLHFRCAAARMALQSYYRSGMYAQLDRTVLPNQRKSCVWLGSIALLTPPIQCLVLRAIIAHGMERRP